MARFAFGMLLPAMREALGMTYDQMGLLGTANFAGYLVAVAMVPLLLRFMTPRLLIALGLLLVASGMLAIAACRSDLPVLAFYCAVGVGSGLANIPIMVVVSYWFRQKLRGRAAGFIVIGSGFAIPAIMAAAIGDYLGKARAAAAFSIITVCFAVGQTLGPVAAGIFAETSGTFTSSYPASACLTAFAVGLAALLPKPEPHD